MALPQRLTVYDGTYSLDGGTTVLQAIDETGCERSVMLVQHAFPQMDSSLEILPGRLYFDGELVPIRSDLETRLLALLRTAEIRDAKQCEDQVDSIQLSSNVLILGNDIRKALSRGPVDNVRALLSTVVEFVESEAYLLFAQRVEQTADTTRYTVWAVCEPATRKHTIVQLGQLLGIGMQDARQLLDSGAPLMEGATALEVSDIATRYSAQGLALHVKPAFRWTLA